MKNVTISKRISIDLTPEQWELFYDKQGVNGASKFLNLNITDCLNNAKSKEEAWASATKFLERMSDYGANDTEPRYVLRRIVNLFFDETAES